MWLQRGLIEMMRVCHLDQRRVAGAAETLVSHLSSREQECLQGESGREHTGFSAANAVSPQDSLISCPAGVLAAEKSLSPCPMNTH